MENKEAQKKAQQIMQKAEQALLSPERNNQRQVWKQIARYILQSSDASFSPDQRTPGSRVNQEVFDSSAASFCRDLASAVHSTLTNPSMKWSKFKFKNNVMNEDEESVRWLDACSDAIHSVLNDSNFDSQIGSAYMSLCGLGTMILLHDEKLDGDQFQGFNFKCIHLGEVALETNIDGLCDTMYRKFKLSPKQAMQMFPEEEEYKKLVDRGIKDELEFIHAIYTRPKNEVKVNELGLALPEHRPIADCYVECKRGKLIQERGYYEIPFYAVRWLTKPEEIYGFGPGHVALPDVLSVNKIRKETLKGLAKAVNPGMLTTQRNMISGDLRPGGLIEVRDINQIKELQTTTRFEVAFNVIEDLKNSIKIAFYIDKLMLPPRTETGEMTAYEVAQRLEQMQQILGPVVSRLNNELLNPLIMRCFKILLRNGQLPTPPQQLLKDGELDLDIQYVNSLARSQQTSELRNIQTWIMELGQMAQLQAAAQGSDILDNINFDDLVTYSARIRSIPEQAVRTEKEVMALRQQRQQAMQQQQMLQTGEQLSGMIKNVGASGLMGGGSEKR